MRRSILASFLIVGAVAAILATMTIAPMSDSETSTGNTVAAGTLDLQVNGNDDPHVGVVCPVGQLAESNTVWCGPIEVSNVGSLDGIADIHFVSASCDPGEEPESETPSGICNMQHDLDVDVIYDESVDGECTGCNPPGAGCCDYYCARCAAGGHSAWYYCNQRDYYGCECDGPGEPPDDETLYLVPTPLMDILSDDIDLGELEAGETDEICISFHLGGLTNEDQGDIVELEIEFTLHEPPRIPYNP